MKKDLRAKAGIKKNQMEDIYKSMNKDDVNSVTKLYNEYAGKDEGELKERLLEMAKQGKSDGTLSNDSIDAMAKKIAPMLSGEKKQRLNAFIDMMKNSQS